MIGVVIDGCPAGVSLDLELMKKDMEKRRPGKKRGESPRNEEDEFEIVSGVMGNQTTGAPLTVLIRNRDAKPESYIPIQDIYRPGHANYTYQKKYGVFHQNGGGRASGRETAARVVAGAIAKQIISPIAISAKVLEIGGQRDHHNQLIEELEKKGDSVGALIECRVQAMPIGLGEPIYEKLEAKLAYAMLSIPATKGFEIGEGFFAAKMYGSEHNDLFVLDESAKAALASNHHGGVLGGISTGEDLIFRVAFKPTSSLGKSQKSVNFLNEEVDLTLPEGSRHDVCIGLRAPPIVEAMTALVLCDLLLMNRCSKIDTSIL